MTIRHRFFQVQQQLQVEIVDAFTASELPVLNLNFTHSGQNVTYQMKLPVYPNKFFEKTSMESDIFFTRWKGLGQPKQETQSVFSATQVCALVTLTYIWPLR